MKTDESKIDSLKTRAHIASRDYERLAARHRTANDIASRNRFASEMADKLAVFDDCVRQLGLLHVNAHDVICA